MEDYKNLNVLGIRILGAFLMAATATLIFAGILTLADAGALDGDHMQDATGANTQLTNQVVRKGWGFMPGNGKFAIEDTPINYGITFDELPFLIVKFANSKQVADGDPVDLADCSITRNVIAAGANQTENGFKPILRTPTGLGFPAVTNYCYTWIAIGRSDASYNGETDPVFAAWDKSTDIIITESQVSDLSHTSDADISAMGYIKSYTETDPVFEAWDKSTGISITESQISDLSHTSDADITAMGYIKSYTETDPVFAAWDKSTDISITESQISDLSHTSDADITAMGYIKSYTETDPVFAAWDKSTDISITESQISDLSHTSDADITAMGYIKSYTETDPVFAAWDKSTDISITESQISDLSHTNDSDIAAMGYIKSYTETDPEFGAWDKSTDISISESQITDLSHTNDSDIAAMGYIKSYTETDPVFGVSDAAGILSTDISNWNTAYGWGDHSVAGYDTTDDGWKQSVGDTWIPKGSSRQWMSVAMSADGSIQTAVIDVGGQIYVSLDYGNTWTAKDSIRTWQAVAMSADGSIQSAGTAGGQIYVSLDSGDTWTAKDENRGWRGIAMSADGSIQTAVVYGGQIYVSLDSGDTWTAKSPSGAWVSVAMSGDGSRQTAVGAGTQIYVSEDSGDSWVPKDASRNWYSVAMSDDGSIQTAVVNGDHVYVSSDYGDTWLPKDQIRGWHAIAMSADGSIQTAAVYNGQIYVSSDSGNNWTPVSSTGYWQSVAMSDDGSVQTAVNKGGQIYILSSLTHTYILEENVGIGTATPTEKLEVNGNIRLDDGTIYLRAGADLFHGVGWYGPGKTFANQNIDGPVLFGYAGGALGSATHFGQSIALRWNQYGDVGIGTIAPGYKLDVNGVINASTAIKVNGVDVLTSSDVVGINGLTDVGAGIKLGGTLSEATIINQGDHNMTFNLDGTGDFILQDSGTNLLTLGNDGVLEINTLAGTGDRLVFADAGGVVHTNNGNHYMNLSSNMAHSPDDISGFETLSGDDVTVHITMPFSITIGGVPYNTFTLSTNGWLEFGGTGTASYFGNRCLPTFTHDKPFLAFYWDDLQDAGNNIRYGSVGSETNRTYIVDFERSTYNGSYNIRGQVQIHETSGLINVKYRDPMDPSANGQSATIGFQMAGGVSAKAYPITCNGKVLDDNRDDESWSISPVR